MEDAGTPFGPAVMKEAAADSPRTSVTPPSSQIVPKLAP